MDFPFSVVRFMPPFLDSLHSLNFLGCLCVFQVNGVLSNLKLFPHMFTTLHLMHRAYISLGPLHQINSVEQVWGFTNPPCAEKRLPRSSADHTNELVCWVQSKHRHTKYVCLHRHALCVLCVCVRVRACAEPDTFSFQNANNEAQLLVWHWWLMSKLSN